MTARGRNKLLAQGRLNRLVGVGVLVVTSAAFYLSYTANSGLPWESNFRVTADVPNAMRLSETNQVRVAGTLVGRVAGVEARIGDADGRALTRLTLELERELAPLREGTELKIRPSSVLGASFVELVPASDGAEIPEGGSLGFFGDSGSVELTDLFDLFDQKTARSIQTTIKATSAGLAGRGADLNQTIERASALMPLLGRVSDRLADPEARLGEFVRSYDSFAAELAGAEAELGLLVDGGAGTFEALASEREAIDAGIAGFAPAARATTRALAAVQPGLRRLSAFARTARPGAKLVRKAVGRINLMLRAGVEPLEGLPAFSGRLRSALEQLRVTAERRSTDGAVRKLRQLVRAADHTLKLLTPAQVHCNVIGTYQYFKSTLESLQMPDAGTFAFIAVKDPGVQGENLQSAEAAPNLAVNYLPNENANECESGNENAPWNSQQIGNPPGLQAKFHPETEPPPGVIARAREAGLIDLPKAAR